jgi:hypothetical protein
LYYCITEEFFHEYKIYIHYIESDQSTEIDNYNYLSILYDIDFQNLILNAKTHEEKGVKGLMKYSLNISLLKELKNLTSEDQNVFEISKELIFDLKKKSKVNNRYVTLYKKIQSFKYYWICLVNDINIYSIFGHFFYAQIYSL